MKRVLLVLSSFLLTGCTVGQVSNQVGGYIGLGTGIRTSWTDGGEIWQHSMSTDYKTVLLLAQEYCNTRGFSSPSLTRGPNAGEMSTYVFKCAVQNRSDVSPNIINQGALIQNQKEEPEKSASEARKTSVEDASNKCLDLGFKKGTIELLGCIEKLR
jgi:hypothetical protein